MELIWQFRVFVERLWPNKTDVLPLLESSEEVDKWARVVMVQTKEWGAASGGISEWMVSAR